MPKSDLLLISAVAFEASESLEALNKNGVTCDYLEIGIGPINAAKSISALKEKAKNANVIYLGSAGTFGSFEKPYLVSVDEVYWMPTAERMGLAKHMEDLHKPIPIYCKNEFDLPKKKVLTSSSVSLRNDVAISNLPSKDELVENMELYSVADELVKVAGSLEIILGITNAVGPKGSDEWFKNFKKVSTITSDLLEKNLCH